MEKFKPKIDVPYVISMVLIAIFILLSIESCSPYKSSWSCKIDQGLGCTSVAYADELARKEIMLNKLSVEEKPTNSSEKTVLITKHYADLKLHHEKEIRLTDDSDNK